MNTPKNLNILKELKERNIESLSEHKIREIKLKILDKDGYCLSNLGSWIIEIFENVLKNEGFIISGKLESYIGSLDLSEDSNVNDFLEKYTKYDDGDVILKCLNTWEQFISDEYPEFGYDKEDDEKNDMDFYLALHFNTNDCGDMFLEEFFYSKILKEVINYYGSF